MKRPSLQWYPKDWRNNAKLRLCSWGARGVWTEAIGLMHDSEEYGIVRATLRQIALALGAPPALVKELAEQRVLKGNDRKLDEPYIYTPVHAGRKGTPVVLVPAQSGPIWFSSRMVRDEYLRKVRGRETRFGGVPDPSPNPAPKYQPDQSPNPPNGGQSGYGAAFASASALDTPEVGVTVEASGPSPPSDTRLNGKPPDIPRSWRASEAATQAAAKALGMLAYPNEAWDSFRDRIAKAIDLAKRAHAH